MHPAERPIFYTDAVVAIAMTLLILPLMESIGEIGDADALGWLEEHTDQLIAFAISFALVAMFWTAPHRLFQHLRGITPRMIWLNFAWMFTIVCLPVVTALTGRLSVLRDDGSVDRVLIGLYMGTMLASSALLYLLEVSVRRAPHLWEPANPPTRRSESVALAMFLLFALALLVRNCSPSSATFRTSC